MIDCRFEWELIKHNNFLFSLSHYKCKNSKYINLEGGGETICAPTGSNGVYKQVSALNMKVSFTGTLETINVLLYTLYHAASY